MLQKFLCSVLMGSILLGRNSNGNTQYQDLKGGVFGTNYRFQIKSKIDFSKQIDSVFKAVNIAANTYDSRSEISILNKTGVYKYPSVTLLDMLAMAMDYYQISNKYFNPAIYPLISEWKAGFHNYAVMDSLKVKQLLGLTVFDSIIAINPNSKKLLKKGAGIDLIAMGEGYTLEAITSILDKNEVKDFILEIVSEMQCRGKSKKNKSWIVGLEKPNFNALATNRTVLKTAQLKNIGLSASGSLRKFYTDS